jgi:hypothetical protein
MDALIEYYRRILELKKRFVKNLEQHCSRKREIYKIWAHWLIRILSKNRVNYHVLSQPNWDSTDDDIIKHMEQNQISRDVAISNYQNLAREYSDLFDRYGLDHERLFADERKVMFVQSKIKSEQIAPENLYILSMENVNLFIKVTSDKYQKLRKHYLGPTEQFLFYLFEYSFNYYLLDGKSLQWSIPQNVFDYLTTLDLQGELFASPINHYHPFYFSLFWVDTKFGSRGNFFTLSDPVVGRQMKGLYEVNPPFIEEIFTDSSNLLTEMLKESESPLGFIYIMPQWENLFGYDFLKKSDYFLGEVLLEKNKHSYFQSSNNKYILASFDTVILIIGNESFKESFKAGLILEMVSERFLSYHNSKANRLCDA